MLIRMIRGGTPATPVVITIRRGKRPSPITISRGKHPATRDNKQS